MPGLLGAGELEGSGEAVYRCDQKGILFAAERQGAKTCWRRTGVRERGCKVPESSCRSKMQSSHQSRNVRGEPGPGEPAFL